MSPIATPRSGSYPSATETASCGPFPTAPRSGAQARDDPSSGASAWTSSSSTSATTPSRPVRMSSCSAKGPTTSPPPRTGRTSPTPSPTRSSLASAGASRDAISEQLDESAEQTNAGHLCRARRACCGRRHGRARRPTPAEASTRSGRGHAVRLTALHARLGRGERRCPPACRDRRTRRGRYAKPHRFGWFAAAGLASSLLATHGTIRFAAAGLASSLLATHGTIRFAAAGLASSLLATHGTTRFAAAGLASSLLATHGTIRFAAAGLASSLLATHGTTRFAAAGLASSLLATHGRVRPRVGTRPRQLALPTRRTPRPRTHGVLRPALARPLTALHQARLHLRTARSRPTRRDPADDTGRTRHPRRPLDGRHDHHVARRTLPHVGA